MIKDSYFFGDSSCQMQGGEGEGVRAVVVRQCLISKGASEMRKALACPLSLMNGPNGEFYLVY